MDSQKMEIVIFLTVMSSSAVQEVKKNLNCTEGGSITLPDPVVEEGFLLYGGKIVASVIDRRIKIYKESFRNRLLWNKDTGLFTIAGLQTTDSGIYIVDSETGGVFISYKLTVYESVAEPGVNRSSVSAESCTLLCFVEKSHETTLYWYKGEERLNQSSSTGSLPLTVHKKHFNSSYRCEAANPVDNKTRSVNVTKYCSGGGDENKSWLLPVVVGVSLTFIAAFSPLIIIFGVYFMIKRKTDRQSQDSLETEEEVTDPADRQGEDLPDSSPVTDSSSLTAVQEQVDCMPLTGNCAGGEAGQTLRNVKKHWGLLNDVNTSLTDTGSCELDIVKKETDRKTEETVVLQVSEGLNEQGELLMSEAQPTVSDKK